MLLNRYVKTLMLSTLLLSSAAVAEDLFVEVSAGYSSVSSSKSDKEGSITLDNKTDNSGSSFMLKAGYNYSKDIDISLNYQRVSNDSISLNHYYTQLDYKFITTKQYTPYIGGVLGYSKLDWTSKPIDTTKNDYNANSYTIGAVLGITYLINENIDINMFYQVSYGDYVTSLEYQTNESEIQYNYINCFNIGLRYSF